MPNDNSGNTTDPSGTLLHSILMMSNNSFSLFNLFNNDENAILIP